MCYDKEVSGQYYQKKWDERDVIFLIGGVVIIAVIVAVVASVAGAAAGVVDEDTED